MKFLIFVLFGLVTIKNVFSLNCYVTGLNGLKAGDIKNSVQDCNDYIHEILRMQGQSAASLPENIDFSCYKVSATSDSVKVDIKGCVPKGGCKVMNSLFKYMLAMDSSKPANVDEITCDECRGNLCNSVNHEKSVYSFIVNALMVFAGKI